MRIFTCPVCGEKLYFDNLSCVCGAEVSFDPGTRTFRAGGRPCGNRPKIGCNWRAADRGDLCESCAMTTVAPDLSVDANLPLWAKAERAKRRVLVGLGRWGWFGEGDDGVRPVFHMLSESTSTGRADVTMGHAAGVVTINLAESDTAERVRRREELGEFYRTMVGHFRHEISHFLFERLAAKPAFLTEFRNLFGDERADYGQALADHYAAGPPAGWQARLISSYATAHPHEDWAESAAHAMHLTDLVDSFREAGGFLPCRTAEQEDPYGDTDDTGVLHEAVRIGVALNHVNRSMGLADLYPFVTSDAVIEKIGFARRWLRSTGV